MGTVRYSNEKVEETICTLCTSVLVVDEINFLFDCNHYGYFRKNLFENINLVTNTFVNMSLNMKLTYLFENKARQLAKYVCTAFTR
jgi:hypothetical protein